MIDLAALKTWLGVDGSDDDALLVDLESRAIAFIEAQTGVSFSEPAEVNEYLVGGGDRLLLMSESPANTPTVAQESIEDDEVTWETVEATKYQVRDRQLVHNCYWCSGETYRVTYQRGFAEGSEPSDIKQAVIDLVAMKYRGREREGVSSEAIGGYNYSKPATYAFEDGDLKQVPGLYATITKWRNWRQV